MPEANKPDWKEIVREHLPLPSSAQEAIPEIAAHLEETYDDALAGGLTAPAAMEFTLQQVEDWRALRKNICRAKCKEGPMNPRTKTLWLPALAVLFAAGLALVLLDRAALLQRLIWIACMAMFPGLCIWHTHDIILRHWRPAMYKALIAVFVLLGTPAFGSSQCGSLGNSPCIVAKGSFVNQTTTIPTTILFTPGRTGLFRLSIYQTLTVVDPNSTSEWITSFFYSDDAGNQSPALLFQNGNQAAAQSSLLVFEDKAGSPVSFTVTQSPGPDNSAYSLYYTVEVLESTH